MKDFKRIHEQKNVDAAMTELVRFCEKYGKVYPKLVERLSDVTSFFSFYDFPESIRPSIYTTNLIENFNKQIKSQCKKKVQFPNEASLERFICGIVLEYNRESEERIHKGFALAQAQLTDFFSWNTKKSTRCLHKMLDIALYKCYNIYIIICRVLNVTDTNILRKFRCRFQMWKRQ